MDQRNFQANHKGQHSNNKRKGMPGVQDQSKSKCPKNNQNEVPHKSMCNQCSRTHPGECRANTRICFKCGKEGHFIRDCLENDMQQEKANAREFTLTKTDAEGNPSVISGELSISKTSAYVLIDSGAIHSFASPVFIRKMENVPDIINRPFSVMVLLGETLNSGQLIKACEVSISGNTLCIDLIIRKMHDYNIILGMDWLSKHYAKINCKKNEATFRPP